MKEKKLVCCKCKKEIDKKKDRWVNVRDFNKGKQEGEVNIHLNCWKNIQRDKIQKAFNKKAKQISPMLQNLMGNILNKGGLTQNA
ncbi:MAG: hypothetical protein ACTSXY_12375 [Promethearchaeota archaeon]